MDLPYANFAGITLLGLGPGDPMLLTRQAWETLNQTSEVYLRTRQHPTIAGFPPGVRIHSFDHLYENGETFDQVYTRIIDQVLILGRRPQGVVYAVPGHPFVAEATSQAIFERASDLGIPVQVVEGISFLDAVFATLKLDPLPHTVVVDALVLASMHFPPFPASLPAIIAQIHSRRIAAEVKLTLMALYPDDHQVTLVHGAGTSEAHLETVPLYQIDHSQVTGLLTTLYVPPLGKEVSFEAFQDLVANLRAPDGCPWDRDQTHRSLRQHLLEEAYEALAALDADDTNAMREEFGDLLLQIVLHAQIASEYGEFNMADVLKSIHSKIVFRHPHVFGDVKIKDKEGVLQNWERLKAVERQASGKSQSGLLGGIQTTLPALARAEAYQKRAARTGFDWPHIQGVFDKIEEEYGEVKQTDSQQDREQEIGDLLFAVVNLARWLDVDAESALRQANERFYNRFSYMEASARAQDRALTDMTLEELDSLWEVAKQEE